MSVEHVHALAKGVRLNQYEMMNILGAGGFGITYMARDTTLDTMVAIKEYLPGDLAVRQGDSTVTAKSNNSKGDFDWGLTRFLEEARVLAKFRHPNIVRVNQIFEANNTAYLVMEYAKGESLDDLLRREGTLGEQQTKDILFPILDGLKRVHELGFLHRDIKPGNIIIREDGGAVLIDFGAARQATETKSRAITSIVTEGYAPLEQYDQYGNQGAWTDIYALGGVAYKCLTGNKPPAVTSRLRNDPLVPLAVAVPGRVSQDFAAAIEAALSVHENARPQNIGEFSAMILGKKIVRSAPPPVDDATRILQADATQILRPDASKSVSAVPPVQTVQADALSVRTQQAQELAKKSNTGLLVAAAIGLVLIGAGGWFYTKGSSTPPPAVQEASAPATAPAPSAASAPAPAANPASRPSSVASLPTPAAAPAVAPAQAQPAPATQPAPAAAAPAFRPSFDCAKANNSAERLICGDGQLAALDVKMTQLYQRALGSIADVNAFNGEQQGFVAQRDVCADKPCLIAAYNDRIKEIERWIGP